MKKSTIIASVVMFSFMIPLSANATSDQTIAQALCAYAQSNDKNSFRKMLSDNRLRLRNIYEAVSCEGLSLIRFSIQNKSDETVEFLAKQLPASFIGESGDIEWAKTTHPGSKSIDILMKRSESD